MITKKEIEKLIIRRKKSDLKNHFYTMLDYNSATYSGDIRNNEILLWKSTSFMRGNYPVFCLTFDTNENLKEISTQTNPFDKITGLIFKSVSILIIVSVFIFSDFEPALLQAMVIIVMLLLLSLLLKKITKYETSLLVIELKEIIKNIENSKNSTKKSKESNIENNTEPKEKTISKTLTRLFAYPFCLFIIYISIVEFIPTGKLKIGIFGIIIPLAYLISDIKIVSGKNKNS